MDDVLNFTSLVTTPYGAGSSTVSYTANGMNEYTAVGGTTHTYDDNGNLKDDGTNTYEYDWRNHLIEVVDKSSSTTIAEYAYDSFGLGRRHEKVVDSDTTRFVYADQQCIEEYDGSDNLLRLFVFGEGLDEIVMMEAPDVADVDDDANTTELKRFYYHRQLIGSVTQVTDPDEVVVESYDYGPYGEIAISDINGSSVSTSQIGNPFTYTGRRLDEETGLFYYRARHYSSELKRFIQRDPLEYVDGPNAYGYVSARSTIRRDPLGLEDDGDDEATPLDLPSPHCGFQLFNDPTLVRESKRERRRELHMEWLVLEIAADKAGLTRIALGRETTRCWDRYAAAGDKWTRLRKELRTDKPPTEEGEAKIAEAELEMDAAADAHQAAAANEAAAKEAEKEARKAVAAAKKRAERANAAAEER